MGRMRFSLRNATLAVCFFNLLGALFLLQGFFSSSASSLYATATPSDAAMLRYAKECEDARLAMQPLELIKRVREIQQETYSEPESIMQNGVKQTAAVDLSKRLKDFHALNDATSLRALEEWRKRKMDRARQRELERNGTASSQL